MLVNTDKKQIAKGIAKQMPYLIEQLDELLERNIFEAIIFSPRANYEDSAEITMYARQEFAKQLTDFIQEGP